MWEPPFHYAAVITAAETEVNVHAGRRKNKVAVFVTQHSILKYFFKLTIFGHSVLNFFFFKLLKKES